MEEVFEFRINYDLAGRLFTAAEGKNLGASVKVVEVTRDNPKFHRIGEIDKEVRAKEGTSFFFGWDIKRTYTKRELEAAPLLHVKIKTTFEPAGEECGTVYDESACEICGANRRQVGSLKLKQSSIPKKDIARTIAGEIVVSEKFVKAVRRHDLKGASFEQLVFDKEPANVYQLIANSPELELTGSTVAGINPFDLSDTSEGETYKCPKGHTIGLNLLSGPYILNTSSIVEYDFFLTKQKIGVKRGLLRPGPLYLCSSAFRKMAEEEKLSGFDFEIAHIE